MAVAYSGGRDSTALLHATVQSARSLGLEVVALHVHHGLQQQADRWLVHCRATCKRWASRGAPLRFESVRLQSAPLTGESVEAWARRERYAALASMARASNATLVLLAHHQRDQAETFLLQALRGAGVAGLAAMPKRIERDGITWLRPWIDTPSEQLQRYVDRQRLRHVHDGSNDDARFARNRLRREVWPALCAAFPSAEASLATAATWAQQARALMAEMAEADLAVLATPTGLSIGAWSVLSVARRSNALRAWLARELRAPAPASLVQRLMLELASSSVARWPLESGSLHLRRGDLCFVPHVSSIVDGEPTADLCIRRAGTYRLDGWRGRLKVSRVLSAGVALARLAELRVASRQGGESFQLAPNRPSRSLKKQYQAIDVPAWARAGPLLYSRDQLVFVAGLGIDARAWAAPGEPQVALQWLTDGPSKSSG